MNFLSFHISHRTLYEYQSPVTQAEHLVKLRPRRLRSQRRLQHELSINPRPTLSDTHTDYFGNQTSLIGHQTPLDRLEIVSESQVAVALPFVPDPAETPAWENVRARILTDRGGPTLEALEYCFDSPAISIPTGIHNYAAPSFSPGRPLLEAAADLTKRIFEDFEFDPTATTVSTPVEKVLEERRGVCQDFAHFQIACFRAIGLAARYVSGYLETAPPPGGVKLIGADASHAWVSIFCPDIGWIDLDPTNGCLPSMRHITIGWGRDYTDICPIKGVIVGGHDPELKVAVDVACKGPIMLSSEVSSPRTPTDPYPDISTHD